MMQPVNQGRVNTLEIRMHEDASQGSVRMRSEAKRGEARRSEARADSALCRQRYCPLTMGLVVADFTHMCCEEASEGTQGFPDTVAGHKASLHPCSSSGVACSTPSPSSAEAVTRHGGSWTVTGSVTTQTESALKFADVTCLFFSPQHRFLVNDAGTRCSPSPDPFLRCGRVQEGSQIRCSCSSGGGRRGQW